MKQNNIQRRTIQMLQVVACGVGMFCLPLLSACTDGELSDGGNVYLRPSFYTGLETRAIVNGTATSAGDGNINQVKLYVTNDTDNAIYTAPNLADGLSVFTYNGSAWSGNPEIKLSNVLARIYAFYPTSAAVTADPSGGDSHSIPVSIANQLTFNGANSWQCSQDDYLYGSSSSTVGQDGKITASNATGSFEPAIHMQHALAQVVFKMQSASGRQVDNTYDFVKKLTLKATSSLFMTGTGTMLLKDGTLQTITTKVDELTFTATPDNSAVKCGESGKAVVVGYGLVAPLADAPTDGAITLTVLLGKQNVSEMDNERELTVTLPSPPQWLKGNSYTYNITLTNRSIEVKKIDENPIIGWDDISGNGELKPEGF